MPELLDRPNLQSGRDELLVRESWNRCPNFSKLEPFAVKSVLSVEICVPAHLHLRLLLKLRRSLVARPFHIS